MRSFLSVVTVALAAASAFAQNSFTINTPSNAVVCQPLLLSWSGGTPPYFLSVLPGSDPSGQALVDLGQQQGTSFTWKVNVAAGTQIGLTIRDSNGSVAQTAPFSINSGSDSSCVGKPVSESTGPTGSGSAPSTGAPSGSTPAGSTAPTTRPATSGTAPTTTTGASSASRSSGSASASATTRNAAVGTVAKVGTAGFVGVAVAALLA